MAQANSSMLSREDYTVGWVCALPLELEASRMMLDQIHGPLPTIDGDTNSYILGSILHHNVVMACLPIKQIGKIKAAVAATNMNRSFPSIRMCLVVGIGGGVPSKADVRLGDVVVGIRIMQYDEGKTTAEGQERTEDPRTTPRVLGSVLSTVSALYDFKPNDSRFSSILQEKLANEDHREFRPPNSEDRLFRADYEHISSEASCDRCDSSRLVMRGQRKTNMVIHYGGIASGNQVMKYGRKRDEIAEDLDVICFDMEAAGVMDVMDCLVIRGICDYSDSHKTKEWQNHAAAAAAAYAKGFLEMTPMTEFQSKATNLSRPPQHILRKRQEAILASLRFKRMYFREHTIKKNHAQTCRWFLNHPIYREWLDPALLSKHPGFIWVHGKPGAGKSTLIKFAWLQTQKMYQRACRDRKAIVASFFFDARGERLEKSVSGMYRSLLVQLLEHFDDLQRILDSRELEEVLSLDSYPLGILKDLFRDAVSELGNRAFIGFIDALDECHELQLMDMVRYFEELAGHATKKGIPLRICFSSRNYPHINIRGGLELTLEKQSGHAQDIANYVRSELQIEDPALREDLVSQILDKSASVFLWVLLVVDILNKEERDGGPAFKSRLSEIPSELSELFKNIIKRDNDNVDDLELSILWILLAQRPLELEEFYHGCWHFKDPMFAKEYTSDRAEKYVLSSTKGLAQVAQSTPPTVQFIHESVRDFLLKDDGLRKLWPSLPFNWKDIGHEQLKKYCSIYIQHAIDSIFDGRFAKTCLLDTLPLLRYATQHVLCHAENAAESIRQDEFLEEFPTAKWASLENEYQKSKNRHLTLEADLLYILSERGFPNLIRTRLRKHPNIHIRGERYKYPLFAALANGNQDAVAALLNLPSTIYDNVDITEGLNYRKDLENYVTRTPLSWAAQEGRAGLVKLLLLAQADVNEHDKAGQTPLMRAVSGGHRTVVAILIDAGADVHQRSVGDRRQERDATPLIYASARGDEALTRLLIENGADVSATYSSPEFSGVCTALSTASHHGHEAVARLLIANGAMDDGLFRGRGPNPLVVAAENGHANLVRLLIENGIDLDLENCGGVALVKAVRNGHDAIAKLLINSEADVNAVDDASDMTPLIAACMTGPEAMVELLIDNGAYVDLFTDCSTPLGVAVGNGHEAVVQLLIDNGADVDAVADNNDTTPLGTALNDDDEAMVRLLIDNWADVNQVTGFSTPLGLASWNGHEAVVQLLIDNGADINAVATDNGLTPLEIASRDGHEAVVQLLIDNGADVNGTGDVDLTPLKIASKEGHEAVVRRLIDNGADVNGTGDSDLTPLEIASRKGHEAVVRLLIDNGADVNGIGDSDLTPLEIASREGHEAVVRLLLEHGAEARPRRTLEIRLRR